MNDMSFLTLQSLISITVPGIAKSIQKVILQFLYLDVLMTEDWLLPWLISENPSYYKSDDEDELDKRILLDFEDDDSYWDNENKNSTGKDHALNEYFDDSGIGSMQFIVNIGSTLVYLVFICVAFILYFFMWLLE